MVRQKDNKTIRKMKLHCFQRRNSVLFLYKVWVVSSEL